MEKEELEKKEGYAGLGCGITSLVLSIVSVVSFQFIIISVTFAIMGVVFGIIGTVKKNGFGKAGLIIGGMCLAFTLLAFLFLKVINIGTLFMIPEWYKF